LGGLGAYIVFMIAPAVFGLGMIASLLLTFRGLAGQSWVLMWAAALTSFLAGIALIFSFGALIFIFTCLQLGAAIAIRRGANRRGWSAALLAGLLVWIAAIPLQILVSEWFGTTAAYILLASAVVWLLAPALPVGRSKPEPS
jgi:hypothetical protein